MRPAPACCFLLFLTPVLLQDDPNTGRRELEAVVAGQPRAVFIGITCGISAPYVLGQVEWAMTQPRCVADDQVLLLPAITFHSWMCGL